MSEDGWDRARLIPTSGIDGVDEQERRAASALLAVIGAVPQFGRAVLGPLDAPAGEIETFIEVRFRIGERACFPDGLIQVATERRTWTALLALRTGANSIDAAQLEVLVDVAHEEGFDAVLTVSNEPCGPDGRPPVTLDPRKLRAVGVRHCTWGELLTEALTESEQRSDADQDRAVVLAELIRYLEHPLSGVLDPRGARSVQLVRRVEISSPEPTVVTLPEPREPVHEVTAGDPPVTVLHTVVIPEPTVRLPPALPSRRDIRLVRQLGATNGEQLAARNLAGWYQDPDDATQLRWWDGVEWTERTYPAQPALA